MPPEDLIRLKHIVDEAEEARSFAGNMSYEEFAMDRRTVKAVIRSVEVIGEAVSRLLPDFRNAHPDIPWQQIVGMRNRLIHVYFDIDCATVWQTVQVNLPDLIKRLRSLITTSG